MRTGPDNGERVPSGDAVASWIGALRIYCRPRMLSMFALGFSSGLPFMLVFSTLSAWLRQRGIALTTISLLSWVSLTYTLKFLWSPVVDRVRLPLVGALLGQRRSWILLAQLGVAASLWALSISDPVQSLPRFAWLALLLAFCGATQDIAIDAWRIESAPVAEQGAMAAATQFGGRLGIVVGSAGALWIAADSGWGRSYAIMAELVGIGIVAALLSREPVRIAPPISVRTERRVIEWLEHRAHWPQSLQHAGAWILGAVLCPVLDFFARNGLKLGLLMFAFIGTYRLTDFTMGVMANPFYLDVGFTLKQVAAVAKIYGTIWTFAGIFAGGLVVAHWGRTRSLVFGSVLVIASNIAYSVFASHAQPSVAGLATIISMDNFAQGVHGTALIAFMSSLTSASYTATQYAVLSSLYALPPKLLMGASGLVVHAIGYPPFYLYTASLSIIPLLLLWWLSRRRDFEPARARTAA